MKFEIKIKFVHRGVLLRCILSISRNSVSCIPPTLACRQMLKIKRDLRIPLQKYKWSINIKKKSDAPLTIPRFDHIVDDEIDKADLSFWYRARQSIEHWH